MLATQSAGLNSARWWPPTRRFFVISHRLVAMGLSVSLSDPAGVIRATTLGAALVASASLLLDFLGPFATVFSREFRLHVAARTCCGRCGFGTVLGGSCVTIRLP